MSSALLLNGLNQSSDDESLLQNIPSHGIEKTKTTLTSPCMVALIEGRGVASEVGVASYNTETAECVTGQLADTSGYSRTLTFLNLHSPNKIVLCAQSESVQTTSKLFIAITEHFEARRMMMWPRKMFNDSVGTEMLTSLCLPELLPSILTALAKKYLSSFSVFCHRCFALSALSRLCFPSWREYVEQALYQSQSFSNLDP